MTYDGDTENTTFRIAPEFGYAFNDAWTVAGSIGYTHMDTTTIRFTLLLMPVGPSTTKVS